MGTNAARARLTAYKCILYGIGLLFIGILQVSFFSKINVFSATPDLLLGAICALAMLEGREVCAICGIISGVVYCSLGGFSYPIYILFSFLCGYILPSVSSRVLGRGYISYLALAVITFAFKVIYNLLEAFITSYSASPIHILIGFAVPEFISSLLFCSLSYLAMLGLSHVFSKSKRKEDRK